MGWMSAICDAHKKKGALNYYITRWRQEVSLVWRPDQLERRCSRENQHPERLGPQAPGWAAQENGNETLMATRVGVNML